MKVLNKNDLPQAPNFNSKEFKDNRDIRVKKDDESLTVEDLALLWRIYKDYEEK